MGTQQGRRGLAAVALGLALAWSVGASADPHDVEATGSSGKTKDALLASGGGCVGGAVLGTVVPGIGNLVGCGVGLVAGLVFSLTGGDDGVDD